MKYRVIHDCDGYRIQKSLFGFIWFDSADAYFYGCVGGKLGEFTIPLKHTFNHKEDAIETAKRLKFRLRYKGHLIRADKNYYVDLSSYTNFSVDGRRHVEAVWSINRMRRLGVRR